MPLAHNAAMQAEHPDLIGRRVGSIRIDERLGVGGMGEVFRGFDLKLERVVALKTIRRERRLSEDLKARFRREARILSKLGHPGICQVHDLIETAEADFLVLEYVDGITLRELVRHGRLGRAELLRIASDVARALAVAHRERIVHRDLKPDNVMLTREGAVKILDFGIARTASGVGREATGPGVGGTGEDLDTDPERTLYQRVPDTEPARIAIARLVAEQRASNERLGGDGVATVRVGSGDQPSAGLRDDAQASTVRVEGPPAADSSADSDAEHLTTAGEVLGTHRYMSPEQASGGVIGTGTDIYAFGVMLGEMHAAVRGARDALGRREAPGPEPELEALISRMTAFEPARRPDAGAVLAALKLAIDRPARLRRRRVRRIAALAGAIALVLVAATLATLAWRAQVAREEADRRRAQAESLIGFMVGELQGQLGAVGRLDLLESVNARASQYFAAIPIERLGPAELATRVRHAQHVAEVLVQLGKPEAGARAFEEAVALAETVAARFPDDEAWQIQRAEALYWKGALAMELNRPAGESLAAMRAAVAINERQLALAPDEVEAQARVATGYHNIGASECAAGLYEAAVRDLGHSLALRTALLPRLTPARRVRVDAEIASTEGWLSTAHESLGALDEALAQRRAQTTRLRRLHAAQPQDALMVYDLVVALNYAAELSTALGQFEAARAELDESILLTGTLLARDPERPEYLRTQAVLLGRRARLALAQDRMPEAVSDLVAARAHFDALLAREPDGMEWRRGALVVAATQAAIDDARAEDTRCARIGPAVRALAEVSPASAGARPALQLSEAAGDWLECAQRARDTAQMEAARAVGAAALGADLESTRDGRALALAARFALAGGNVESGARLAQRAHALGIRDRRLREACATHQADCGPDGSPPATAPRAPG